MLGDRLDLAARLDSDLGRWSALLDDEMLARLGRVKERFLRVLPHVDEAAAAGILQIDDAVFVRESILRWLPAALEPYLELPAEERRQAPVEESVAAQLDIVERRLAALDDTLAAERLSRVQRSREDLTRTLD